MCGIVGVLAHGQFETKKEEKIRQEAIIYLTTELLSLTQARGKDATGLATLFEDGDYMGLKMGISAQEFITRFGGKETDYEGFLSIWRKKTRAARIIIGHCRKPSTAVGAGTEDNNNNHPIKVGDIVGLHNGTLTNHDKIFDNLKCGRDSKVDSEAIFRLLNHLTDEGKEPFSMPVLQECCQRLHGTYSCLAFNGNNPYQLVGFRDGRPMEFALIKPLKLLLIASDKDYLKIAITRYNKMAFLYQLGANKFPGLKKGDVEFGVSVDDSAYMFDVTQEITDETKLADLYQTEKIPRTGKLWAKTTAWNNKSTGGRAAGGAAATTGAGAAGTGAKKTEVTAGKPSAAAATHQGSQGSAAAATTQTQTSTDTAASRLGMAWNRSTNRYTDVEGAKKTTEHGGVVIDIEGEKVTDLSSNKVLQEGEKKASQQTSESGSQHTRQESDSQHDFSLRDTNMPVDDLVTDPSKIVVAEVADVTDEHDAGTGSSAAGLGDGVYAAHKGGRTVVESSSLATDGDVLEKAMAATREVESFSNDEECADTLEMLDSTAMNTMARYSLVNRAKNHFFKTGWYAGYMAAVAEGKLKAAAPTPENSIDMYARTMLERVKAGKRRSSTTIRAIKVLVGILANSLEADRATRGRIQTAVVDAIDVGREVNLKALEKAFKAGDRRDLPVLNFVFEQIKFLSGEENSNVEGKADSSSV